jgi:hypothetical protein
MAFLCTHPQSTKIDPKSQYPSPNQVHNHFRVLHLQEVREIPIGGTESASRSLVSFDVLNDNLIKGIISSDKCMSIF